MLKYIDTPVEEIILPGSKKRDIKLFVKREDKNHEFISGNKWWKLKYNLAAAQKAGYHTLLTFGGAFSNHIYATAAAAKELGLKSIGIIRGEEIQPLNETLQFAKSCGMKLHYVSREKYREKNLPGFRENLAHQFGNFYLIPEGGTNPLALKGCAEFAIEKLLKVDFDYLCLPVGTGGTVAGIIAGFEGERQILGFSVLKNGGFLRDEIKNHLREFSGKEFSNWEVIVDYDFGGYAKRTLGLEEFIAETKSKHNLPIDFVYTGKMMAGIFDLISKDYFPPGSKILALHTGGLRN